MLSVNESIGSALVSLVSLRLELFDILQIEGSMAIDYLFEAQKHVEAGTMLVGT